MSSCRVFLSGEGFGLLRRVMVSGRGAALLEMSCGLLAGCVRNHGFKADAVVREFRVTDRVGFRTRGQESGRASPIAGAIAPLMVKVRSAGEPRGPVTIEGDVIRCPDGIAGVAPGQSAVFYDGDAVVGGGIVV